MIKLGRQQFTKHKTKCRESTERFSRIIAEISTLSGCIWLLLTGHVRLLVEVAKGSNFLFLKWEWTERGKPFQGKVGSRSNTPFFMFNRLMFWPGLERYKIKYSWDWALLRYLSVYPESLSLSGGTCKLRITMLKVKKSDTIYYNS